MALRQVSELPRVKLMEKARELCICTITKYGDKGRERERVYRASIQFLDRSSFSFGLCFAKIVQVGFWAHPLGFFQPRVPKIYMC